MGHFHNPVPGPILGATAAQPFTPPRLAPSLETVPNPPFRHPARRPEISAENAAIAQPDPWVYAFEGTKPGQPYGPGQAPPSTLIVPNPPFVNANKNPPTLFEWASIGQPDPWVYVLQAGNAGQPYAQGKLSPGVPGQSVDNPPPVFEGRFVNATPDAIVRAWQPDPWVYAFEKGNSAQPYEGSKLPPSLVIVPNPPFVNANKSPTAIWQNSVFGQPDPWPYVYPAGPQPYGRGIYTPIVVTFTPYSNIWIGTVIQSWFVTDPPPTLPRNLNPSQLVVPNPPFINPGRNPVVAQQIVNQTQPDPWSYPFVSCDGFQPYAPNRTLAPSQLIVPNPPFAAPTQLPNILAGWQPPDLPPSLPGKLSPGIPGQSVDNPPRVTPFPQPSYPIDVPLLTQQKFLQLVIQQGPYNNVWLASVVQSWFGPDPAPILPRNLTPSQLIVPNPPFPGVRWQPTYPPDVILISGVFGIPQSAAAAASNPYVNPWYSAILQAWQPVDLFPTLPRNLPPSTLIVPNPPFPGVTNLPNILAGWQPPDPAPTIPGKLSPGIPGQSVDNPPLLFRKTDPFPITDPPIQLPKYFVQPAAAVVAQNPFVESWLSTVLQSWQISDPPPTLPRTTAAPPGWSVDNPPGIEANLVISWLPPDNQPTLSPLLPPSITAVPVNNPPFSHYGRSGWVAQITVLDYQPPDPLPTLSGKLPPSIIAVRVDNPPFSSRTELPGILAQWAAWPPQPLPTPSASAPQVQPGPPPPPVIAQFTVSGPDVSVYLREFLTDVVYTDAPITKRTV